MNEKGLIDKVEEIVQDDLLGLERGQRELEGEDDISRLTVGDECVKGHKQCRVRPHPSHQRRSERR